MCWELTTLAKEKDVDLVVLLLDFEKAYDRVDWCFLEEVMLWLGFPCIRMCLAPYMCWEKLVLPSLFQGRLRKGVPWPFSCTN